MMTYDEARFSCVRRVPALTLVVGAHLLVIAAALYSRYLSQVTVTLPPARLDVTHIEQPPRVRDTVTDRWTITWKTPRLVEPLQPPPEVITAATPDEVPPPLGPMIPRPSLPEHKFESASIDPQHPLRIGDAYYPDASIRLGEEGRCRVRVSVGADGRIGSATLEQRTGSPRLDAACLEAVRGQRMRPATLDGKPIASSVALPIVWRLTAAH